MCLCKLEMRLFDPETCLHKLEMCLCKRASGHERHLEGLFEAVAVTESWQKASVRCEVSHFQ